ncbi:ribose-5-phosphate isomerase RpiA [Alkalicoccus saliphilus]|nr:ribose-5-phosphate isomerase RpiA [Alkalicoccus saliphilus]
MVPGELYRLQAYYLCEDSTQYEYSFSIYQGGLPMLCNNSNNQSDIDKKMAAEKAVELIKDGMKVGLGSGSTVFWAVKKLGEEVQKGLEVQAVPSSVETQKWAEKEGIPLFTLKQGEMLDVTLDGADEIDKSFNIIKGGGGAHLREKIIAASSNTLIIIAEKRKQVQVLGKFPVPVEIVPFEAASTLHRIASSGCRPELRKNNEDLFVTDNGNYIADCFYDSIYYPDLLHEKLKSLVGVVETGLFVGMADKIILADGGGVHTYTPEKPAG